MEGKKTHPVLLGIGLRFQAADRRKLQSQAARDHSHTPERSLVPHLHSPPPLGTATWHAWHQQQGGWSPVHALTRGCPVSPNLSAEAGGMWKVRCRPALLKAGGYSASSAQCLLQASLEPRAPSPPRPHLQSPKARRVPKNFRSGSSPKQQHKAVL